MHRQDLLWVAIGWLVGLLQIFRVTNIETKETRRFGGVLAKGPSDPGGGESDPLPKVENFEK